jgi:hypothetical protein
LAVASYIEPVFRSAITTKNNFVGAGDPGRCAHVQGVVVLHVLRGAVCCPDGSCVDGSELLTQDIDWRQKDHLRSTAILQKQWLGSGWQI